MIDAMLLPRRALAVGSFKSAMERTNQYTLLIARARIDSDNSVTQFSRTVELMN